MSVEQTARGHGIAQVSCSLSSELGNPDTPEAWHKALLLPDTFTVESVTRNDQAKVYELAISSEFLPKEENIHIIPVYSRDYQEIDGQMVSQPTLRKIEFTQWDGENWTHLGSVEVVSGE